MSEAKFKPGEKAYLAVEVVREYDGQIGLDIPNVGQYWINPYEIEVVAAVDPDRYQEWHSGGYEDGYEAGLSDAWEAARKTLHGDEPNGLSVADVGIMFQCSVFDIIKKYTAAEAIAKIKAWKEAKEIHVGDIVKISGRIWVVTRIFDNWISVISRDGQVKSVLIENNNIKKAGRTVDVAGFLRQIGGGNES